MDWMSRRTLYSSDGAASALKLLSDWSGEPLSSKVYRFGEKSEAPMGTRRVLKPTS